MKIALVSLVVLGASVAGVVVLANDEEAVTPPVRERRDAQENADADALYNLVKQARAELRDMRMSAGLSAYAAGPQAGHRESRDDGEGRGEDGGGKGGGEGGERGGRERGARGEGGEEGGAYLAKMTKQNELFANGARLVLRFNPNTQVFVGSVTNTTARTLSQVRVEIHLDNGTELGPTKRMDIGPGETIPVELGTFGNEFTSWVSHPEAGSERGHGAGGEGDGEGRGEHGGSEGRGEHGGGACGAEGGEGGERGGHGAGGEEVRPRDLAYRPLYNQLQILLGEMRAFEVELKARSTGAKP